jgi:hypothetical protein
MGILFKLMFWPFSAVYLQMGMAVPILLIVAISLKSSGGEILKYYFNNMILRLSIISFLVIMLFFTSSVTLVKIIHSDDPERVRLQTQFMMNPDNEEYKKEFNEYIDKKYSEDVQSEENGK